MSAEALPTREIIKGILGSQILSVPFSCSLSFTAVILTLRYLSKTAPGRANQQGYFEYPYGRIRPFRSVLARWGAALVAIVCVVMTAMELTIVYQTAVVHPGDMAYLQRIPWTSSLVPILSSFVSVASQTYFSGKACHVAQSPTLKAFLVLLGIGSLATGASSSVALILRPSRHSDATVTPAEALFWAYLSITTLSSFVILIPLVGSYLRERRVFKMEARRNPTSNSGPTSTTSLLRFLLSTYTLVFMFDFVCLVCAVTSASSNFFAALHATQAFLVLQKLMVRIMALSYLYALLDAIPKAPASDPSAEPQVGYGSQKIARNGKPHGFAKPKSKSKSKSKPQQRELQQHSAILSASGLDTGDHTLSSGEDEEADDIFAYTFPPGSAGGAPNQDNRVASEWGSIKHTPVPKNIQPKFSTMPRSKPPPVPSQKPPSMPPNMPPSMPTIPTRLRHPEPTPSLSADNFTTGSSDKPSRRLSQLKYINSPPFDNLPAGVSLDNPFEQQLLQSNTGASTNPFLTAKTAQNGEYSRAWGSDEEDGELSSLAIKK